MPKKRVSQVSQNAGVADPSVYPPGRLVKKTKEGGFLETLRTPVSGPPPRVPVKPAALVARKKAQDETLKKSSPLKHAIPASSISRVMSPPGQNQNQGTAPAAGAGGGGQGQGSGGPAAQNTPAQGSGAGGGGGPSSGIIQGVIQTPQTGSTTMVQNNYKGLPAPGTPHAPSFSDNEISTLPRFIERMRLLFSEKGVKDDARKKEYLGMCADPNTEVSWRQLDTYANGTFEEHVIKVILMYPDVGRLILGSTDELNKVITQFKPVHMNGTTYPSYQRAFLREANKLKSGQQVLTEREMVQKFIVGLDPFFAQKIWDRLELTRTAPVPSAVSKGKQVLGMPTPFEDLFERPEDRYTLEEVVEAAQTIDNASHSEFGNIVHRGGAPRENWSVPGFKNSSNPNNPPKESAFAKDIEDLKETMVNIQTSLGCMDKKYDTYFSGAEGQKKKLDEEMQAALKPKTSTFTAPEGGCFYCKGPHYVNECEDRNARLDKKELKIVDGKLCWGNGGGRVFRKQGHSTVQFTVNERLGPNRVGAHVFEELEVPEEPPRGSVSQLAVSQDSNLTSDRDIIRMLMQERFSTSPAQTVHPQTFAPNQPQYYGNNFQQQQMPFPPQMSFFNGYPQGYPQYQVNSNFMPNQATGNQSQAMNQQGGLTPNFLPMNLPQSNPYPNSQYVANQVQPQNNVQGTPQFQQTSQQGGQGNSGQQGFD